MGHFWNVRWVRILFGLLALCTCGLYWYWILVDEEIPWGDSNLFVVLVLNLNIIAACVLAVVVVRNIAKLIFDRRKNILGARLRLKLVAAFLGLTLVPTVLLFILANGLLTRAIEGWFSSQVEVSRDAALTIARAHYTTLREQVERVSKLLNRESLQREPERPLGEFLEEWRKRFGLYSVKLLTHEQHIAAEAVSPLSSIESFREPKLHEESLQKAFERKESVTIEEEGAGRFVRSYAPWREGGVLVVTFRINPEVSASFERVTDSYTEYEQLKLFKHPLKSGYVLTLTIVTGLILFGALWIALYIARQITVPVERLLEGTLRVARGDYTVKIDPHGDDEVGALVAAFNQMTTDLAQSRAEVEERRLFVEGVLRNLQVGVITFSPDRTGISVNNAAVKILALSKEGPWTYESLPEEVRQVVGALFSELAEGDQNFVEAQCDALLQGRELKLILSLGEIIDQREVHLATVLLIDDVTELTKAQNMAAWREVARRIAHEIKNPLTPIQLSAQRIEKLVSQGASNTPLYESLLECAQSIVQHVDSIKRLANEFSHFARMPTAELQPEHLNELLSEVVSSYAERTDEVTFQLIAAEKIPPVSVDREQLRRALVNLFENSIAALKEEKGGKISVKSGYDRRRKMVTIEVADNGPGIPAHAKRRIFDPYYTTKTGGTGLGLPIVLSIVNDHQGKIRVYDNHPKGAKFIIELPLSSAQTARRRMFPEGAPS